MAGENWPPFAFSEVRAFAWPDEEISEAVILPGMTLKPNPLNKNGSVLSPSQIARLLLAIKSGYPGYPLGACYNPHNAFLFYDANGRPVAFFEVCFGCFNYNFGPQKTAQTRGVGLLSLAAIFDELKLPMGEFKSASDFKKHIDNLVTEDGGRFQPNQALERTDSAE